jgi:hypothetical protein
VHDYESRSGTQHLRCCAAMQQGPSTKLSRFTLPVMISEKRVRYTSISFFASSLPPAKQLTLAAVHLGGLNHLQRQAAGSLSTEWHAAGGSGWAPCVGWCDSCSWLRKTTA